MPLALQIVWFLSPVVDGVVFPEDPVVLLTHGQVTPVPYVLGVNNAEFEWTLPFVSGQERCSTPWACRGCSLGNASVPSQISVAPLRMQKFPGFPVQEELAISDGGELREG